MGRHVLGAGSLTRTLGNPCQGWMPEKDLCTAPDLTKTRGGGRLLCWPPRKPAHLGCSAATGHLCCQAGLSAALPRAVTSLQDALQHKVRLHWVSLGTKIRREGLSLSPFPRCFKRDLPPPNQLCDVDTTYELQMWVSTAVGNGQDILRSPQCWQKAELETTGGSPGQPAAGGGAWQGAAPAEMPGSLSLGPGAAARGRHQLGLRWEKHRRGDPETLHAHPAPGTCPFAHRCHRIQKGALPAPAWS